MSTQDPKKDIRRIMGLFFLASREKPEFKVMEELINQHHAEINKIMLGSKNFPCPDIDHLKKVIGDGEPNRKFIDWLWRRRGIPALTETINDRMASGQPSFLREMLNPGERVDGGNDDDQQDLRNQIAALSAQNTALNAQNTALNAQYAEAVGKLHEEQRTTGLQLSEISRLGREKASLEAQNRSLQERIGRLEEKNADLVKESKETDARLEEKQENLHELQRLIEEMTLEKNGAKDATRVDGDEHAAQDNDEHNGDDEESDDNGDEEESDDNEDEGESDDKEDEEESEDNEEGCASDGNEDRDGKQDTLSLLGNAMQKVGNVAASVASGAVGLVTTGVARAVARASGAVLNANGSLHLIKKKSLKKKTSGKTPTKVTRQPGGSGGMAHKRTREDAGHSKSEKPRLDETNPKRSRSNDGGAGPSDGKKHCPA